MKTQSKLTLRFAALAGIVALGLAGCTSASSTSEPEPVTPAPAEEQADEPMEITDVNVRLDWLFQGPNAGFVVAQELGYYEEVGINATINPGQGGATTIQAIGNGSEDFGYADSYVAAQNRAQGVPVKVVASIIQNNPVAVVALGDSGIDTAADLAGKSVGFPTGSVAAQQWSAFLAGCGVTESDVTAVSVQPQNLIQSLLAGSLDAVAGFSYGFIPVLEANGQTNPVALPFPGCGMNQLSNGIVVNDSLLESNPDLVKRFVEATIRGFLYMFENPEEAADIVLKYAPESNPAVTIREIEEAAKLITRDGNAGQSLGWMSEESQQQTVDNAIEFGEADASLTPADVFTNDFVPQGAEYQLK